jgi:hypothetical protein
MTGTEHGTWESIWPLLLTAACELASAGHELDEAGRAAASIILAHTSLDAFLSEFVEWRNLPRELKEKPFDEAITTVYSLLGAPRPQFSVSGEWRPIKNLNTLRNKLVHHTAESFKVGESPGRWYDELVSSGAIVARDNQTWERNVCRYRVAKYACQSFSDGMLRLEGLPKLRRRSIADVSDRIASATRTLRKQR